MSAALDVKASALHIVDVVIPKLVHDIGDLEMGMAVIGSYDIELKRQNEQMSKLDKVCGLKTTFQWEYTCTSS